MVHLLLINPQFYTCTMGQCTLHLGAILVLTSDLCRLSLPISVRKLVLTLSLSVNYLHELIYIKSNILKTKL